MRRRDIGYLPAVGAVLAGAAQRSSAQESADWREETPEHVTIAFDRDWLETYQPLLVTRGVSQANINGLYGMRASSGEWDVDVGIYCMSYSTQDGALAPPVGLDGHFGDHEWFYTFVGDNGLEEIAYAAYHWIAGRASGEDIPTFENDHPKAQVDERWHNYYLTDEEGSFQDLRDLTQVFQSWLNNGMDDHLYLPAVTRAVTMHSRESWWESGLDRSYAKILYSVGLAGADVADEVGG